MANSQQRQKFLQRLSLSILIHLIPNIHKRVAPIIQNAPHFRKRPPPIFAVFAFASLGLVHYVSISNSRDTTAPELHLVASKGASLVAKDVFDLAELLD
jgi:hypothetical protein